MSATPESARIVAGDDNEAALEICGHTVVARTVRSPDKPTPNEDAALVMPVGADGLVLAVADGVGGSPGGADAARLVIGMLAQALAQPDIDTTQLRTTILDTIENANNALLEPGRRGATTLVVAEIVGRQLRSYHVGDSELLVFGQRGRIKARIIPHSPTGFAVEAGLLDEDEAVQHEYRHILFNAVGAPDMRVDVAAPVRLAPFDTALLASDGLVDNLFVDEIVAASRRGPLPAALDRLVRSARERMLTPVPNRPSKPDDLTIILCRERRASRPRQRRAAAGRGSGGA